MAALMHLISGPAFWPCLSVIGGIMAVHALILRECDRPINRGGRR